MTNVAFLSSRAVLRVSGPEARSFLQGIVTQDIERLKPGEAAFSALLTPQGKILFDFFLVADGDGFLLDCGKETAEALERRLKLYRLRAKADITHEDGWAVAAFPGGAPPSAQGVFAFADPRLAALGARALGPSNLIADLAGAAEDSYEARRLALGVPEFGKDFSSDEVFLLDVDYDALNAVSYAKGCFIGQEVASRMKRKSDVRKRTLIAKFEGAAPAPGAAITAGDLTIGKMLSGREDHSLALVRLDRLKAARKAGDVPIADEKQLQIVFPDWLKQD